MTSRKIDHLRYSPPGRRGPGELHIVLYDGGTIFNEVEHLDTGILEVNPDFTQRSDPDPEKRFQWSLVPGKHIENDNVKAGVGGPLEKFEDNIEGPLPLIKQNDHGIRMPNLTIDLPQLIPGSSTAVTSPRRQYLWSDCLEYGPVGQALDGHGEGNERWIDHFYQPGAPNSVKSLFLRALPGPGRYGIKYQEGTEAMGARNQSAWDPVAKTWVYGREAEFKEPVEDVFFHSFDTTDLETFKVTTKPWFYADEEPRLLFPVGPGITSRINLYLIPRQWMYFCYILAWYAIITMFWISYHPLQLSVTFYDRPPVHPHPFTGQDYMAQLFGGMDDYGVYWKVTHSPEFLELLQSVYDFQMTSWLMGIVFIGISDYYYRVRCFGAKARQLCAVVEDSSSGHRWYVWRREQEEKDKITLVDSKFYPEGG